MLPPSRTDRLRNLLLLLRRGVGLPKEPFLPSPAVEVWRCMLRGGLLFFCAGMRLG